MDGRNHSLLFSRLRADENKEQPAGKVHWLIDGVYFAVDAAPFPISERARDQRHGNLIRTTLRICSVDRKQLFFSNTGNVTTK